MGDTDREHKETAHYSSPPCASSELEVDHLWHPAGPPTQAQDVPSWRRAERQRLRGLRMAISATERHMLAVQLAQHLQQLLARHMEGTRTPVVSAYWPIKGELDLRPLMTELYNAGTEIALPVVETRAAPLIFRRWTPATRMVRGDWNIPVPPADAPEQTPDILLAPCVGWSADGYRLGYGGGYFDRTLASLNSAPMVIGIGLLQSRIATIHPQPHDIRLDMIMTEQGVANT